MTRVLVAASATLADALVRCDVDVVARCSPDELAERVATGAGLPDDITAVVVPARHVVVGGHLAALCDAQGIRIVAVADDAADAARASRLGIVSADASDPWSVVDALAQPLAPGQTLPAAAALEVRGRVIVVWGAAGAPGRSTIATLLAGELARGGRRVALVDADTHAPALGLMLGLADEGPGFAAACRAAETGTLDAAELQRISQSMRVSGGAVEVLCGINRPGRWPELSADRVEAALGICRDWAEFTVVDVGSSLERDEEILSDLDGPRRSAATLAALAVADLVVAVGAVDPLGMSRLLRGLSDLRGVGGGVPMAVIANKLRPGALGMDARGQVRRALDHLGGVEEVWFAPFDQRATDAALRDARLISEGTPRAAIVQSVRRFVGEALLPALGVSIAAAPTPTHLRPHAVHGARGRR